ncbi:HesA/MoeB/ThiF family protein [Vibrio sp. S4M6]|uniref:HesA/MoeB/ThiF family protein n=1 Tax=Vibrio sinus TaxID=2946865 RepID=UPI00202AA73E|nr:HesA/MoeB/ThiF family protein [Vibrio sinus]MCL9782855.1 HesA/MoeB/ThiF family protein [Vibrio sinus]
MLNDEQFLRYQRQVAMPEIGESGQANLSESHVLVIGCGGLGCSVALFLAGAGVGKLVISDDDSVDISNLQRQIAFRTDSIGLSKTKMLADQIEMLNPDVSVRTLNKRLKETQLKLEVSLADIIIDCTDNFSSRHLVNRICFESRKPLVSGAAIGWKGQFVVFDYQQANGCYRCLYPFDESQQASKCSDSGIIGPVVGTIGNLQALAAIQKLAMGKFQFPTHMLHSFDGLSLGWQQFAIPQDHSCDVCGASGKQNLGS